AISVSVVEGTNETNGSEITLFVENGSIQGALAKDVAAMTKNMTVDPYLRQSNRNKRKKLFFDDDPDIILLKSHDSTMRINYGEQIIESCRSMKALLPKIRRHLIKISCKELVRKSHSNHPSTDQREQLAKSIVSQLYP
ncbi:unnamed protein product, partial [Allacma fusca]